MTLSDHTGDQVGGDDTALRVCGEEDCVGATKIVDPGRIGEIRFVQSKDSER